MKVKDKFAITGMSCAACQAAIQRAVERLEGIISCNVSLLKNTMEVEYDKALVKSDDIIKAVKKAGYEAALCSGGRLGPGLKSPALSYDSRGGSDNDSYLKLKKRFVLSLIFTLPLFYLAMGPMAGFKIPEFFTGINNAVPLALTLFILSSIVVIINFQYFKSGIRAFLNYHPNMDSLVALGAGSSMIFSVYALYRMVYAQGAGDFAATGQFAHSLYFEGAAVILTLITLGKALEQRAKGRTKEALNRLMDLTPKTAVVIKDGREVEVLASEVKKGDHLIVRAGEAIPVDAVVIAGAGAVDESLLSGESLPVDKKKGDKAAGAAILVSGYLELEAEKVGDETVLAGIIAMVDEAASSKAPVQRLADKVSGIFVPAVMVIAAITFVSWLASGSTLEFALTNAVSVLVVSCPCALGLAAPTSIMVGTAKGAEYGLLIKTAAALEKAAYIKTLVLDKTGTITEGRPQVIKVFKSPGVNEELLFTTALSLEKLSSHPIAGAVTAKALEYKAQALEVKGFTLHEGLGVSGFIGEHQAAAGNALLMDQYGIDTAILSDKARSLLEKGMTVLYFAFDNKLLGIMAVADRVKADSKAAIAKLKSYGLDVIMLTGDNYKAASSLAAELKLENFKAEVLPQDKAFEVAKIQKTGRKAAMAGDGINDAPALAQADLGIALGAGTDIAMDCADIVLVKDSLFDIAAVIELGRAVLNNIRQNLFWAFIYNVIGITIAAGLFYHTTGLLLDPMLAALAMSLSSVFVVSNALRLRFFKPKVLKVKGSENCQTLSEAGTLAEAGDGNYRSPAVLKEQHQVQAGSSVPNSSWRTIPKNIQGETTVIREIDIKGMMCEHCVKHVTKALSGLNGVLKVSVSLEDHQAVLELASNVPNEVLTDAVVKAGYEVIGIKDRD